MHFAVLFSRATTLLHLNQIDELYKNSAQNAPKVAILRSKIEKKILRRGDPPQTLPHTHHLGA